MSDAADAVIIGSGILGCAIALELRRAGFTTLNVDRLPAAGYGSTSSSASIIRPYYSTTEGTVLALEGHYSWQAWVRERGTVAGGSLRYRECGCLVLKSADNGHLESTRNVLSAMQVPFEDVDGSALAKLLPNPDLRSFSPVRRIDDPEFGSHNGREITGAIFCPTGGYIDDAQLACRQVAELARNAGAQFLFNTIVTRVLGDTQRVRGVQLDGAREIHSSIVVNAAGPHSSRINALANASAPGDITTQPVRQEVAYLDSPRNAAGAPLEHVLTDADCGIYLRPDAHDRVLIGSLEPPCDTLEVVDADAYDEGLTAQWENQVWRAALRFPQLGIPNRAQGLAALYDVSQDWIPVYDRSALEGYFMAIGTSGNQFKNALVVGKLMAQLIERCMNGADQDTAPLQFRLTHTGNMLDTKAFSRRRGVNARSSFSVLG